MVLGEGFRTPSPPLFYWSYIDLLSPPIHQSDEASWGTTGPHHCTNRFGDGASR